MQEQAKTLQLAMLLAHERAALDDSSWKPYIEALPEALPNGWGLSNDELSALLPTLGVTPCYSISVLRIP